MKKLFILTVSIFLLLPLTSFGQKSKFVSGFDEELSIKKVTVGPVVDNLGGIYSQPLKEALLKSISDEKQWGIEDLTSSKTSPEEFLESTKAVQEILKKSKSDALLTARISKGPSGLTLKIWLFVGISGKVLVQDVLENLEIFDLKEVQTQFISLYFRLKGKLPYRGIVLSRKGLLVTINYGSLQGAKADEEINVIQLLSATRHPKFNFITSVDQEIMGTIRLSKVEESLSFGVIVKERSEGTVRPLSKVIPKDFVIYPDATVDARTKDVTKLNERADSQVALGDGPKEWVPVKQPSYGRIGLQLGLGTMSYNTALVSSGPINGSNSIVPNIKLESELWLNPYWFANFNLKQSVLTLNNSLSGSSPGRLNASTQRYDFAVGYNFLVQEEFFGPKIQISFGSMKYASFVDASSPLAFSSAAFSGLFINVGGSFPVEPSSPLTLGANMYYMLSPRGSESPVTSGESSSSRVNVFSFHGGYRTSAQVRIKGSVDFETYGSTFSGVGSRSESASSLSQRLISATGGIEYSF
jgi:hypothetical protein